MTGTVPSNPQPPVAGASGDEPAGAATHEGGPARRARITREIMERTGIDEAMIERLVRRFYRQVQADPLLGPVFAPRIADWEKHIAKLCAFWSSVALMSGRYHGQPMQVHVDLPVDATHFDRWIALFENTANEICPPTAAQHFIERARRIADSIELAMAGRNGKIQSPRFAATVAGNNPAKST
ncbi:Group III truncated hemoglobin [Hyphomicrobiales bacterium]|nr:Group III truncated hemoglobin [Hyphomicrobiales bacterium]CAH1696206.1 Group III truncated hemoglobin [Hyphomicrobiales bacterium]